MASSEFHSDHRLSYSSQGRSPAFETDKKVLLLMWREKILRIKFGLLFWGGYVVVGALSVQCSFHKRQGF